MFLARRRASQVGTALYQKLLDFIVKPAGWNKQWQTATSCGVSRAYRIKDLVHRRVLPKGLLSIISAGYPVHNHYKVSIIDIRATYRLYIQIMRLGGC